MNLQQSEAVNCGLGLASMALWDAWAHHVGTLASRADTPLTIVAGGLRCRVQSIILWLSATHEDYIRCPPQRCKQRGKTFLQTTTITKQNTNRKITMTRRKNEDAHKIHSIMHLLTAFPAVRTTRVLLSTDLLLLLVMPEIFLGRSRRRTRHLQRGWCVRATRRGWGLLLVVRYGRVVFDRLERIVVSYNNRIRAR